MFAHFPFCLDARWFAAKLGLNQKIFAQIQYKWCHNFSSEKMGYYICWYKYFFQSILHISDRVRLGSYKAFYTFTLAVTVGETSHHIHYGDEEIQISNQCLIPENCQSTIFY